MTTRQSIIEIRGLTKLYIPQSKKGNLNELVVKAVDELNLKIFPGEYVAITGPSGSGKSTLMQILGLLERQTSGDYLFLGKNIAQFTDSELSEIRSRYIGFVFQSFNLLNKLSASDNVELPLIYSGMKSRTKRVSELLQQVGLSHRAKHLPTELSGGQQQRVAIARSLANKPCLIFADEPTGNLNQESAKEVMENLEKLNDSGVTVIVVTHDPNIANQAKRMIEVVDGKIVKDTDIRKSESAQTIEYPPLEFSDLSFRGVLQLLRENFSMAVKGLAGNLLRTSLSALGIMIGVASVIAMVGLGKGAQVSMESELARLGSNVLSINGFARFRSQGQTNSLTLSDSKAVEELHASGAPIKNVSSVVAGGVSVVHLGKNRQTSLQGVNASYEKMYNLTPEVGDFFTEQDDIQRRRVVLIGDTVYRDLFPSGSNPIGSYIKLDRISFQVIGVLPAKGASQWGDRDDLVIVPFQTAMYRILGRDRPNTISVQAYQYEDLAPLAEMIRSVLRQQHKLRQGQDDDFIVQNLADIQQAISETTRTMTSLLGIIAGISLIVGGIGIMNIMLVSVKERTREIGLRKAIGAQNFHILIQFLIEAIVVGIIGGLTGILFGIGISEVLSQTLGWNVIISPLAIGLALLFSMAVGVVFGFLPARQASNLSPIEALRY
jgi:macrolide transport system ATP-binding/permease protein